jgi:eukaryotic-like serine/threonine-protein kinase
MQCQRCGFVGTGLNGRCPRCGYQQETISAVGNRLPRAIQIRPISTAPANEIALMRGDVLRKGRYRLLEEVKLPKNQQGQGTAWLAVDTQSTRSRVLIRRCIFPNHTEEQATRIIESVVTRLTHLSQYQGFPPVVDVFSEYRAYYIVQQYPAGESLAFLMQQLGGALHERDIAEYGRQLCAMLTVLASQHPPLVHGAISPETIIVNLQARQVSLIFLPLFPPDVLSKDTSSGYMAPEQVRGDIKPSSDLYSLAASMHHAVTGFDPRERLIHFYPPARRLNPVVTSGMEAILSKELRLSFNQRYANPVEMQRDLQMLLVSYPPVSETPPPPGQMYAPVSQPLRKPRKQRTIFVLVGVCIALVLILVAAMPFINNANQAAQRNAQKNAQEAAWHAELAQEQQLLDKKGIGLSDGSFIFDTYSGRSDVALKKQASEALQKGDMANAINFFSQAVSSDPTDGEAQIYNENLHVLQSGSPYVTIVLGIAFDSGADDLLRARPDTQGVFIAQYEINKQGLLPHGLKLRILIDSCGPQRADVSTVAQLVANRVKNAGNPDHIVGVVGWPFSSQTINALDIIASVHLPLVSPASSVKLTGSSPYFFRIDPPDDVEGKLLASASQQMHVKTVLVLRDPTDPYSVSLADAFSASTSKLGIQVINNQADHFTESKTTVADYEKIVADAESHGVNQIFIAGYSIDGIRLSHALGNAIRNAPFNTTLSNLSILGGDGVDTTLVIGQGNDTDAQIAATFPQDMRHLSFTAYCAPNEWDFLHIAKNQQPLFFTDWVNFYQGAGVAPANIQSPGNDSMMATDGVQLIAKATTYVQGDLTGQSTRDALASLGYSNIPAFQGVTGRFTYDKQGNPIDKAMVVLSVVQKGNKNVIDLQNVVGTFH